jgi:hypothetical protein
LRYYFFLEASLCSVSNLSNLSDALLLVLCGFGAALGGARFVAGFGAGFGADFLTAFRP